MKEENLNTVLYQKLGNKWYIFTETEQGEIIYTALPEGFDPQKIEHELIHLIPEKKRGLVHHEIRTLALS